MSNRLKMAMIHSIQLLHSMHWSQRRIARELGIDRETVRKYLACGLEEAKPAIPPTGSDGSKPATFAGVPAPAGEGIGPGGCAGNDAASKPAIPPTGSEAVSAPVENSKPAIPPTGSDVAESPHRSGRQSECERFREVILEKLDQDLSAQRIYQDLVADHGFKASYDSVKRFVRKLSNRRPLPMRRLECLPGEEAQVDFGTGAPIIDANGKRKKTHVFRIVLSHSRKAYSEVTYRQTTEDFITCVENAFRHFGGCPKTLVIDNLRAAVKHPDWFEPELVPKLAAFCEHYGVVILPTRPYMPRHKGKVESGVKYVQNNALKGRKFQSLEEQNTFLSDWERGVADTRIHGTTKKQVGKVFDEVEQAALSRMPLERFPFFHEGQRIVSRDGHVEVAKSYYSAPPEYLGRTVWVRWDSRVVRIFNDRFEPIAMHVRQEPGWFSTHGMHIAKEKISGIERGAAYLLAKVSLVGEHTRQWAEAVVVARGIEGSRVLLGLLNLTKKYSSEALEKACETALSHAAYQLRTIRQLLKRPGFKQETLPFLDEHPIIRPLDDYGRIVAQALERKGPASPEGFLRHGWTKAIDQTAQQKSPNPPSPESSGSKQELLPPSSGYPSPGCTSAEPDSVSPDSSMLRSSPPSHQEKSTDE
jgi:transposase